MVDKALTAIQLTDLFLTATLEWNGFADGHQTWPEFKSHFQEAYELHLQSGRFIGNNPYHDTGTILEGKGLWFGHFPLSSLPLRSLFQIRGVGAQGENYVGLVDQLDGDLNNVLREHSIEEKYGAKI